MERRQLGSSLARLSLVVRFVMRLQTMKAHVFFTHQRGQQQQMQQTLHLERGSVVGAGLGESSASVGSEESSHGPSSTTRVGIAPLPCSMDTTFSWEQFLQHEQQGCSASRLKPLNPAKKQNNC